MKPKAHFYLSSSRVLSLAIIVATVLSFMVFRLTPGDVYPPTIERFSHFQLYGNGFLPNAIYPTTVNNTRINRLELFGCWSGVSGTATAASSWMPLQQNLSILIAGYPQTDGTLAIQVRDLQGNIFQLDSQFENVGESWTLYSLRLPASSQFRDFRLFASGGTGGFRGWFGFSEPFRLRTSLRGWTVTAGDVLRITLVMFLSLVLFYGPGLVFRHVFKSLAPWEELSVMIPVIGILLMASVGLMIWTFGGHLKPRSVAAFSVVPMLLLLALFFWRVPIHAHTSPMERRALFVVALLVVAACAKATYSLGPRGELYESTISRTLEVGDRSDSRATWGIVELIANRAGPTSAISKAYFFPYDFSSRGPLAGMASAPIVLASRGRVSPGIPGQTWRPFDQNGFATYRITMIVMGTSAFLTLFWTVSGLLDVNWAYFSLLCASLTPFLVHELYFTWPKLQATAFTILAAFLLTRRRPFPAGLSAGIGYLVHPLVVMSAPALIGIIVMIHLARTEVGDKRPILTSGYRVLNTGLIFGLGFFFWVGLWRVVNWTHYAQLNFLVYFRLVGQHYARSSSQWWHWRISSLASTVVPLYMFLERSTDLAVNSVFGRSSTVVHFFFQYWTTAPFGLGICAYPAWLILLLYFGWRHKYQFAFFVLAPLFLMVVYMGSTETGLLREGLHAWIFFCIFSLIIEWRENLMRRSLLRQIVCFLFAARVFEVLAMFIVPAVVTHACLVSPIYLFSDSCSLALMLTATILLAIKLWRSCPTSGQDVATASHNTIVPRLSSNAAGCVGPWKDERWIS